MADSRTVAEKADNEPGISFVSEGMKCSKNDRNVSKQWVNLKELPLTKSELIWNIKVNTDK